MGTSSGTGRRVCSRPHRSAREPIGDNECSEGYDEEAGQNGDHVVVENVQAATSSRVKHAL